jgi:opacity protein-like surface antigen
MRTPLLSAITALVLFAPGALANDKNKDESPWYIQYGAGVVLYIPSVDDNPDGTVDWDAGWEVNAALGYDLGSLFGSDKWSWSLEAEGIFSQIEVDGDDIIKVPGSKDRNNKGYAWLGNVILDYHFTEQTAWYFGGGIGWEWRRKFETWDQGNYDQPDTNGLAYQFKTGLKYNLGGRYDVMIGYRLFATDEYKIKVLSNNTDFHIDNIQHSLEVGVRFGL